VDRQRALAKALMPEVGRAGSPRRIRRGRCLHLCRVSAKPPPQSTRVARRSTPGQSFGKRSGNHPCKRLPGQAR